MAAIEQLVMSHLDIWSSVVKPRSTAGRGTTRKLDLYGIKKLRELILELAVHGLLVPQDPNEEPATVLLKKIVSEKAKLIKKRKIKKPKQLPPIGEEEKPFKLPQGWEWARVQDLSEYVQRGKGPKYSDYGKVRVISQKCVQWKGFNTEVARYVDDESLSKYKSERYIRKNDLLWNSTGTGTAGRINLIDEIECNGFVADSHVTVLRFLSMSAAFICRYISSPGIQMRIEPTTENSLVSGTTNQVELNTSTIVNLPLPLPPIEEQHRIVTKVDELMTLCDQLEEHQENSIKVHKALVQTLLGALTSASKKGAFNEAWGRIAEHFGILFTTEDSIDQLKQTILQLAVMGKLVPQDPIDEPASVLLKKIATEKATLTKEGKAKKQRPLPPIGNEERLFELPVGWEWCKVGDVSILKGGFAYKSNNFIIKSNYQVVRMGNIRPDKFRLDKNPVFITPESAAITKEYEIVNGDILLTMTGTKGKRDYLYSLTAKNSDLHGRTLYLNQRLCIVRCIHVYDAYINLAMKEDRILDAIYAKSTGTANQANIGMLAISNWIIPLPPLMEQHNIVAKVHELMTLCDSLKANINTAQTTQLKLADAIAAQAIG